MTLVVRKDIYSSSGSKKKVKHGLNEFSTDFTAEWTMVHRFSWSTLL
jgi:hypothetical protein